ncbi:MAG: CDP-diacylglycerol--glycerol-3-phosphate 3-phosphatidyltransferase [Rhodobacteraceae bacterium]|nr:MAG: CDP-diacylglycerol--glycerol-3-phosphate 3-phosphatidyltransferase [Paracoccaceae bacterium]
MRWTIPNILTTLRLIAAPGVAIMFLYFARPLADWYAMILFMLASITDFFDGYLARLWKQETNFGRMLDPVADKAMVVIALLVIVALSGMDPWLLVPATVILFREVFVSGLREFLGSNADKLQVTKLAKWKTTIQMVAIAVLFLKGLLVNYYSGFTAGMDQPFIDAILGGDVEDVNRLGMFEAATDWARLIGRILLWLAAILTAITGLDYFRKALPFLKDIK